MALTASEEQEIQEEQSPESKEAPEEEETDNALRAVSSTMVSEIGFDEEQQELEIVFLSGRQERYSATKLMWEDLKSAPSVGKWMHENVL